MGQRLGDALASQACSGVLGTHTLPPEAAKLLAVGLQLLEMMQEVGRELISLTALEMRRGHKYKSRGDETCIQKQSG